MSIDFVWGVPAPPVCTAFWNKRNWQDYAERYRPNGYTGGITDSKAFEEFTKKKEADYCRAEMAKFGLIWKGDTA